MDKISNNIQSESDLEKGILLPNSDGSDNDSDLLDIDWNSFVEGLPTSLSSEDNGDSDLDWDNFKISFEAESGSTHGESAEGDNNPDPLGTQAIEKSTPPSEKSIVEEEVYQNSSLITVDQISMLVDDVTQVTELLQRHVETDNSSNNATQDKKNDIPFDMIFAEIGEIIKENGPMDGKWGVFTFIHQIINPHISSLNSINKNDATTLLKELISCLNKTSNYLKDALVEAAMPAIVFLLDKDADPKFLIKNNVICGNDFVTNILATLILSGKAEEDVLKILDHERYKKYLHSKPTLNLKGFSEQLGRGEKRNLAELAAWYNQPRVLDKLLMAGVKMPKPKKSKIDRDSIKDGLQVQDKAVHMITGECSNVMRGYEKANYTWKREYDVTLPDPRPRLYGYSEEVNKVLVKHVVRLYLRYHGQTVDDKERRTLWMWIKNAWMHVKAFFGYALTKHKVLNIKKMTGILQKVPVSRVRDWMDNLLYLYIEAGKKIRVFKYQDKSDGHITFPMPNMAMNGEARPQFYLSQEAPGDDIPYKAHFTLFRKKDRGSQLRALFENALCEPRGEDLPKTSAVDHLTKACHGPIMTGNVGSSLWIL